MIWATHPGKLGDLLWALPAARHISRQYGQPINLWLAAQCKPLVNLLEKQDYIGDITLDYDWQVQDTAPASPRMPPGGPAQGSVVHLGYAAWPERPLPFQVVRQQGLHERDVDWSPWIAAVPGFPRGPSEDILLFHWTDRWFELKLGLTYLLTESLSALPLTAWSVRTGPESARWPAYRHAYGATLENIARQIAACSLVVTDCSAVHVLTAAMGKQCVVVEPETDRHHFIFWPGIERSRLGEADRWLKADNVFAERIFPVLGIDGLPTFDARHTADLIKELLHAAG